MANGSGLFRTLHHRWLEAKELAKAWAAVVLTCLWLVVFWTLMAVGCLIVATWCGVTTAIHFDRG